MYLVCFNVSSIVSTNFTGSENPLSKVIEICISHSNQSDELIQLVNHYQVKFNPERRWKPRLRLFQLLMFPAKSSLA